MYNNIIRIITIAVMAAAMTAMSGCGHSETWKEMDKAENVIFEHPDSALAILDDLDTDRLKGKKEAARYALLKSMALDKNYIFTTDFDVLKPAIDYYPKHGTPDEKMRTFYYQGCIFMDRGDAIPAMRCFLKACDLKDGVLDSLTLAHAYVALGFLNNNKYKLPDYIENNVKAANLYNELAEKTFALHCYTNAAKGYIYLDERQHADSILSICPEPAADNQLENQYMFTTRLAYVLEFGTPDEIRDFLERNKDKHMTKGDSIDFAQGYSRLGMNDEALGIISRIRTTDTTAYTSVKAEIHKKLGQYKEAYHELKDYITASENEEAGYWMTDALYIDERHKVEVEKLEEANKRKTIVYGAIACLLVLLAVIAALYYRMRLSKSRHELAEAKMQLEMDGLKQEAESLKGLLEDEKSLSQSTRALFNSRLEALNGLLEAEKNRSNCARAMSDSRMEIFHGLLASKITKNKDFAKSYNELVKTIQNDKEKFLKSLRNEFAITYPIFMNELKEHNLTDDEINMMCLFGLGLKGKDIGNYLETSSHYNTSSSIRGKLGLEAHDTNLNVYVRTHLR